MALEDIDCYYFFDASDGAEVLCVFPHVIFRWYGGEKRLEINSDTRGMYTLAMNIRGLESAFDSGLVKKIDVDRNDVNEYLELKNTGKEYSARKKGLEIFIIAKEDIMDELIEEDEAWADDEDDEDYLDC